MHIQHVILFCSFLFCSSLFASEIDPKLKAQAQELMRQYEAIFSNGKFVNVDKIFSDEFLKALGGKEQFIKKVEASNKKKSNKAGEIEIYVHKSVPINQINLKNGNNKKSEIKMEEMVFSSFRYKGEKQKSIDLPTWFVLKKDAEGNLRISGTVAPEGEK